MRKHIVGPFLCILITFVFLWSPALGAVSPKQAQKVWDRLSTVSGLGGSKTLVVEDKEEPNAWVSFRGSDYSIHVTKGLLNIMDQDDEIAGIFAHEIGHIKLGHYRETVSRNLIWYLLYRAFGKDDKTASTILRLGLALAESGFSREMEVEADDFGVQLAHKAGYNPWGLYNALLRMKEAGYSTTPNGFNSHPPTERRLEHIRNTTISISGGKGAS